jgi:hypothetical protein
MGILCCRTKHEVAAVSLTGDALEGVDVEHVEATAGPVVVMCGTVLGAARDSCLVVTHTLQTCACVTGKHLADLVLGPCNNIQGGSKSCITNSVTMALCYKPEGHRFETR